ncbi:MAG: hybrid sensor histidine kinase/response regulator [Deltaproteobacteria bacterium]|nr:hybrid sensor histidine kinase/response regulator [Deltaproteobacteria bacterium]
MSAVIAIAFMLVALWTFTRATLDLSIQNAHEGIVQHFDHKMAKLQEYAHFQDAIAYRIGTYFHQNQRRINARFIENARSSFDLLTKSFYGLTDRIDRYRIIHENGQVLFDMNRLVETASSKLPNLQHSEEFKKITHVSSYLENDGINTGINIVRKIDYTRSRMQFGSIYVEYRLKGFGFDVLEQSLKSRLDALNERLPLFAVDYHHNKFFVALRNGECVYNIDVCGSTQDESAYKYVSADDSAGLVFTMLVPKQSINTFLCKEVFLILVVCLLPMTLLCFLVYKKFRIVASNLQRIKTRIMHIENTDLASCERLQGGVYPYSELTDISNAFLTTMKRLGEYAEQVRTQSNLAAIGRIASQVAHDIRSPLTALRVVSGQIQELPERKRLLIRRAVQRMEDIAHDLAGRNARSTTVEGPPVANAPRLLSSLIEPLISEKRIQFRHQPDVTIDAPLDVTIYGLFTTVDPVAFQRVLSNLINNAVEALVGHGTITCTVTAISDILKIAVCDDGPGIPSDVLPQLMQRGATFGKPGGSGLGLYHARSAVEQWHGTLTIDSSVGRGTTVLLTLPRAAPPAWFVPELVLPPDTVVVIVDDDPSIHQVWDNRFAAYAEDGTIMTVHFSCGTDVVAWYAATPRAQILFLCDYEFCGEPNNGLDLVAQLQIADRTILVTSYYEDGEVRTRCANLGVRLIPKGLAGIVPIRMPDIGVRANRSSPVTPQPHILVIDDDPAIHLSWELMQERLGVAQVTAFASMEACEAATNDYAQFACAFVDKRIPESTWRIDQVIAHLKAAGIPTVLIASGDSSHEIAADPLCQAADGIVPLKVPNSPAQLQALMRSERMPG